jgi:hypothetical protein
MYPPVAVTGVPVDLDVIGKKTKFVMSVLGVKAGSPGNKSVNEGPGVGAGRMTADVSGSICAVVTCTLVEVGSGSNNAMAAVLFVNCV